MRAARGMVLILAVTAYVWACGGGEEQADEAPVRTDPALAARGESLMQSKGCIACHTLGGGRLVGPDLAGVSERRDDAFIVGMITNPDSMLANNATAKQLLAEYFTPMANQGVSRDDALALLAYFKREDAARAGNQP